jgi:hypothetical protein
MTANMSVSSISLIEKVTERSSFAIGNSRVRTGLDQ